MLQYSKIKKLFDNQKYCIFNLIYLSDGVTPITNLSFSIFFDF